jgi:tetratricopeptide (TPR) repeat protein
VVVLEEADIISGTDKVEHVSRGMALKVRGSRPGGWLWVTRHANGWVQSKHVVPLQTAMDYLAAEIAQQPRHAPFYNDRATVQFEIGNYAGAIRDYSMALQLVPGSIALRANRAVAYFELGQFDRAVQDLNEVVRHLPEEPQGYVDRGWALYHAGRHDAAMADYEHALGLDPDSVQALVNLAWLKATCPQENLRDGKEARKLAEQICEQTEQKDPFALATLAAAQAE